MRYRIQVDIKKYNKAMGYQAYPAELIDESPTRIKRAHKKHPYQVGDVVRILRRDVDESDCVGVVLGCIDAVCGELRTDAEGMVGFKNLRHATMRDLLKYEHSPRLHKYLGL